MTEQQIRNMAEFMQRVQLQAAEIPAWQDCMQALSNLAQATTEQAPPESPDEPS